MKFDQILELIQTVSESKVTTFKYEEDDMKIVIRTGEHSSSDSTDTYSEGLSHLVVPPHQEISSHQEVSSQSETKIHLDQEQSLMKGNIVTCPLVGTFYAAPSENADTFVKIGDMVKKGQTLAIVEAMKLMNEIECEYDGEVVEILVENAKSVEYGQPMFVIR